MNILIKDAQVVEVNQESVDPTLMLSAEELDFVGGGHATVNTI